MWVLWNDWYDVIKPWVGPNKNWWVQIIETKSEIEAVPSQPQARYCVKLLVYLTASDLIDIEQRNWITCWFGIEYLIEQYYPTITTATTSTTKKDIYLSSARLNLLLFFKKLRIIWLWLLDTKLFMRGHQNIPDRLQSPWSRLPLT